MYYKRYGKGFRNLARKGYKWARKNLGYYGLGSGSVGSALVSYGKRALSSYQGSNKRRRIGTSSRLRGGFKGVSTLTKYKKRRVKTVDSISHNSSKILHKSIWVRRPKKLYKPLGKWQLHNQCTGHLETGTGTQNCDQLFAVGTSHQSCRTSSNGRLAFPDSLFSMNPYQYTTGGSSSVIPAMHVPNTDKLYIKDCDIDIQLTNGGKVSMAVELICFYVKDDMTDSGGFPAKWTEALVAKREGQLSEIVPTYAGTSSRAGYPTNYGSYGMSPFSEKLFNKFFRPLWRKTYVLDGGSNVKTLLRMNINRVISHEVAEQKVSAGVFYTKGDIIFGVITRPSPAAIVSAEGGGLVAVSTGATQLLWTSTQNYNIQSLGGQTMSYDRMVPAFVTQIAQDERQVLVDDEDQIVKNEEIGYVSIP